MSQPSRSSESRGASLRPAIGGQARGRLEIDISGLPPDKEVAFIRETYLGERDDNNIQEAFERGFEPATPEMFPNAVARTLPGVKDETHGVIRRGGQILMIRDKEIGDQEREFQKRETAAQKRAAQKLGDAPEASLDDKNFVASADNKVSERHDAGEARRPKGEKAGRFPDA